MAQEIHKPIILGTLKTLGAAGVTIEEMVILVGDEMPGDTEQQRRKAIQNGLFRAKGRGEAVLVDGRYYLKRFAPKPSKAVYNPPPYTNGTVKPEIAQYAAGRKSKTVMVYTTPETHENAIGIVLYIKGQEIRIPLFNSVRLCIGPEAPKWSPDQEMYVGVDKVVIHHKGGGRTEKLVLPHERVVIAPEE